MIVIYVIYILIVNSKKNKSCEGFTVWHEDGEQLSFPHMSHMLTVRVEGGGESSDQKYNFLWKHNNLFHRKLQEL